MSKINLLSFIILSVSLVIIGCDNSQKIKGKDFNEFVKCMAEIIETTEEPLKDSLRQCVMLVSVEMMRSSSLNSLEAILAKENGLESVYEAKHGKMPEVTEYDLDDDYFDGRSVNELLKYCELVNHKRRDNTIKDEGRGF